MVAVLSVLLLVSVAAAQEMPVFLYGQVVDINPGSHVISVRGDDNTKWRFKVTASTQLEKHLERPEPATFEDLRVGSRVRILIGLTTMNPAIRQTPRIFVYR
jgi:hypothetical protein